MDAPHARPDGAAFKAAVRGQWDAAAAGWDRNTATVRRWLADATTALLDGAGVAAGSRVLDVAAGAGDQSFAAAGRVGRTGHVLATDLSPAFVALIRGRAAREGERRIEARVADGENLGVAPASFDAAICRLGLMLFPDPGRGLREMAGALRSGGRAATLVFSGAERNPCIAILVSTAFAHAGLPPPEPTAPGGLLSLGLPGRVDALFREAGFDDVVTTAIAAPFRLPSVDDYLAFVRTSASPVAHIVGRLDAAAAAAAWSEMRERLAAFATPSGWEGPNELWLTTGRRP